jgi:hypothetical protein
MPLLFTSNSNRTPFCFFLRTLVFLCPLLLIGFVYEGALWCSGESWSVEKIIDAQLENPDLVWRRGYFSQFSETYKFFLLKRTGKDIVVVGSSRTLSFRREFFHPLEDRFINGGRLLTHLGDLVSLTRALSSGELPRPQVLIIGLDPWWLKGDSPVQEGFDPNHMPEDAYEPGAHISAMTRMINNGIIPFRFLDRIIDGRDEFRTPYCSSPALGLAAVLHGSSFRSDGSSAHEEIYVSFSENPSYRDRENPPVIERVRNHSDQFFVAPGIHWGKVALLMEHLEKIRSLGVELYVFFPPFSNEVADATRRDPALRQWWEDYWDRLPEVLAERGIQYFGVESPAKLGLDDRYMLDGFHPSEVFIATLLTDWLGRVPEGSMSASIDQLRLKALLKMPGVLPVGLGCDNSLQFEPK